MKKFLILFLIVTASFSSILAQENETLKDLRKIYESLEYNTIAFEDLKKNWVINDPTFVREIYNKFVVKDALRINDKKVDLDFVKSKTEEIYDGQLVIIVRKRYYDDEIEFFAFVPEPEVKKENPAFSFDPITDGFYLKDVLGTKLYERIQEQTYFLSDVTKDIYDVKAGYFFKLYLNMLEPEIMFWNTTSDFRNKYLLSYVGKWGEDYISFPGWQLNEYIVGTKLTYYEKLASDPRNYTYSVTMGINMPAGRPFVSDGGSKPLFVTGNAFYYEISANPLKYFVEGWDDFVMTVKGKYTVTDFTRKDLGRNDSIDFYSNRSYFVLDYRYRNLLNLSDFGMLEVGAGLGLPDMYHYQIIPNKKNFEDLDKGKDFLNKYSQFIYFDVGVTRFGGLIQHDTHWMLNYNIGDGYGYFGARSRVMLSDNFGFDIGIQRGFGLSKTKFPYRTDAYLVFSPILKINY